MSAFTEEVARRLAGIKGVCPGIGCDCPDCRRTWGYGSGDLAQFRADIESGALVDEGGVSWSPCDSCGSRLGGNRYDAHGWLGDKLVHLAICEDCLCYWANGDEPKDWQ